MAVPYTLVVTVPTAGTAVQVSTTDLFVKRAVVVGAAQNTGHVYLGTQSGSLVGSGFHLKVGQNPLDLDDLQVAGKNDWINLKTLWVDVSVNGEKATFLYFKDS